MEFLHKKTFMEKLNNFRIYTEQNHSLEKDWLKYLIHPIKAYWGDGTLDWGKHKENFKFHKLYFRITVNITKADVAFLPLTLNYYTKNKELFKVSKFIDLAKRHNLKSYIWIDGDNHIRFMNDSDDCVFIKYFSYKSKFLLNELIRPGDLKYDLLESYYNGNLKTKKKSKVPVVGFDGLATYPNTRLLNIIIKNIILKLSYNLHLTKIEPDHIFPYLLKRNKILKSLKESALIETNFKIRSIFAEGTLGKKTNARDEFLNNIISSDYTLCYRGAANYSLRFYETLCLGRIPLLINTDCRLPLENKINWQEVCLIVKEKEIKYLPELILNFHNSHTKEQFIEKQMFCREIWVKNLSKVSFYKNLYREIESKFIGQ